MESKKGLNAPLPPLQAEEYIRKMIKKRRLLTGAELGNCLLCRIGYDIKEPTDEFILKTIQHWTSQTDFDAYYLRLEIRDFLLLLHNSAVYAQAKGHAEGLNVILVNTQIAMQAYQNARLNRIKMIYDRSKKATEAKAGHNLPEKPLEAEINDLQHSNTETLRDYINTLINTVADKAIKNFTDSLTFILNTTDIIRLFAEHFNLDLHTYEAKEDRTALIWQAVDSFNHKGIKQVVDDALTERIIDKKTHDKAINTIKQASAIDTKEATEAEKEEVREALKEIKTQADFIHLREWIIQKMIKTTSFI